MRDRLGKGPWRGLAASKDETDKIRPKHDGRRRLRAQTATEAALVRHRRGSSLLLRWLEKGGVWFAAESLRHMCCLSYRPDTQLIKACIERSQLLQRLMGGLTRQNGKALA